MKHKQVISLFVSGSLLAVIAAPSSIGTVNSPGEFRLNGATIHGNSTVFDGNLIETAEARSVIKLPTVQITLAPQSRARVFRGRAVLENGTGSLRASGYVIEAATLRITPASKGSVLQVEMYSPNHVAVSASSGSAEVRNAAGVLVASLRAGMALAFDPLAAASAVTHMTGILRAKGATFLLTDATTDVTVELRGADLAKYIGQTVSVTGSIIGGTPVPAGTSQVVQVIGVSAATGAKAAAIGAAGAGAAGGASAGVSTAAIAAIVGGVAVGGTAAGLAVVGTFSGASSISRQ